MAAPRPESPLADVSRRRKRGDERESLLRARATELFLERGYDSVSLDELVRDVGGSKGAIYEFYGGKEGLFIAVMDALICELATPVRESDLRGFPLRDGLRILATTLLTLLLSERHLAMQRLIVAEGRRHPALAQNWYLKGPAVAHDVLKTFLVDQQDRGHLRRNLDAGRAAVLFHDMIVFDLMNRSLAGLDEGPQADDVAATIEHAVELITLGLASRA